MSQVLLPWCAGSPLQQELVVRPYWYCHGSVSSWSTRTGPLSRTAGDWHLVLQECLPHTARGFRWCKVSLGALVMAQSLIPLRHGPSPSSLLLAHGIFPSPLWQETLQLAVPQRTRPCHGGEGAGGREDPCPRAAREEHIQCAPDPQVMQGTCSDGWGWKAGGGHFGGRSSSCCQAWLRDPIPFSYFTSHCC